VSSAKSRVREINFSAISLIYILNNRGPSTNPWGRSIFEYGCEVWDNCGVGNSNKLDHLQLEAARIVTGLPIFASSILIYSI
jgi:hypothetical protein